MATSLRLPPELEAALKQLAKEHQRSDHGEMIYALRQYVEAQNLAKARKLAASIANTFAENESIQQ